MRRYSENFITGCTWLVTHTKVASIFETGRAGFAPSPVEYDYAPRHFIKRSMSNGRYESFCDPAHTEFNSYST